MGIPQIIMIIIFCLSLGITMAKNGQPREDKYSFFTSLVATGIQVGVLIWGGFFN